MLVGKGFVLGLAHTLEVEPVLASGRHIRARGSKPLHLRTHCKRQIGLGRVRVPARPLKSQRWSAETSRIRSPQRGARAALASRPAMARDPCSP
eukprot:scaffold65688_cov50-Phaeocystis_antarctica.AAC.3